MNAARDKCVNVSHSEVVIIPMVPMSPIEWSAGSYLGVSRFLQVGPIDMGWGGHCNTSVEVGLFLGHCPKIRPLPLFVLPF